MGTYVHRFGDRVGIQGIFSSIGQHNEARLYFLVDIGSDKRASWQNSTIGHDLWYTKNSTAMVAMVMLCCHI